MFKIPLFPRCLFSPSSLSGPMRFSHPVDTTDRRNTKVHLGVLYRQYYGFLLSSCPPALLSSCIIKNTSKKLLLNLFLREQVKKVKKRLNCICELNDDFNGRN